MGEIYGKTKIGQTFVARHNNLSAIEVLLATYNGKNRGNFLFHLKREEEDLFTYKGNLSRVKDNAYFRFAFPRIE